MSLLDSSLGRIRERVRRSSGGSVPPAGSDRDPMADLAPGVRERGGMRQRLRALARRRQSLLLELGALSFELHRRDTQRPELVRRKAAELTALHSEARALAATLGAGAPPIELPLAAPRGECRGCGWSLAVDWAYCPRCGNQVSAAPTTGRSAGAPAPVTARPV